jgi:O-antigen ligase
MPSKKNIINILDNVIQTAVLGFAAALPVSIAFFQVSLGVGWAAFLSKWAISGKWPGFRTRLDPYFGLFLLACLLASAFSLKPAESFVSLKKFYVMSAVYLVVYNTGSLRRIKELVSAWLLTSTLTGIYGMIMVLLGLHPRLLGAQGMAMTSGSIYMMASLVSFWYLQESMREGLGPGWRASVQTLVITASLGLTKTLSAWLGWLGGIITNPPFKKRWVSGILMIVVIAGVVFIITSSATLGLNYSKGQTWQARLTMWSIGWQIIKEYPLTGVGLIDLGEIYQSKRDPTEIAQFGDHRRYGHLHNIFIHITAITGFTGLVAFLLMFWGIIKMCLDGMKSSNPEISGLCGAVLSAVTAFLIGGLAEWSFGDSEVVSVIWFLTGLAVAGGQLTKEEVPGIVPNGKSNRAWH